MPQDDREDFSKFLVEATYIAQDGICLKCGGTLEKGFHRHHLDGDHSNNSPENLVLMCANCHRAEAKGKDFQAHKRVEKAVFKRIDQILDKAMNKELAGTVIDKISDLLSMQLRLSRNYRDLDVGIEYPPASFTMIRNLQKSELLQKYGMTMWKEGYLSGVNSKKEIERGESDE